MPTKRFRFDKALVLRNLPGGRYFYRHSLAEQLDLTVFDHPEGRELSGNEKLAMALNELAALRGRGFFFHCPRRDTFYTWPPERLYPQSRRAPVPGAQYTEIIYMDFRWSEATRTGFDTASQRARYLKCDARINLPIDETPLYGIQYMSYRRQPIYAPPKPVLNIVETNTALYICNTPQFRRAVGIWNKNKAPAGPDPALRLNQPQYLWQDDDDHGTTPHRNWTRMQQFRVQSLESLYDAILDQTQAGNNPDIIGTAFVLPAFTAGQFLYEIMPRPDKPEQGFRLGTRIEEPAVEVSIANEMSVEEMLAADPTCSVSDEEAVK